MSTFRFPYVPGQSPDELEQARMQQAASGIGQAAQMAAPIRMAAPRVNPHDTLTVPLAAPAPEAPPLMSAKAPKPEGALDKQEASMQKRLEDAQAKDANPYGTPNNHPGFGGKLLHGLNVFRNIAETAVTPGIAMADPTSTLHRQMEEQGLTRGIQGIEKQKSEQALQEAQTGSAQAETGLRENQAEAANLTPATTEEAEAFGVPEGTMLNAATRAALAKQKGINETKRDVATQTNQTKQDIADAANLSRESVAKLKPEQRDDRAIRLMQKPPESRTQEENAYLGAYAKWVQQTKVAPGIARAAAFGQFRPVQILGPDGDVHYDFSGHAIQSGAASPGSMNFQTAKRMAQFMTSGKGGSVMTAYRTASDHLDLLKQASDALQNGDVQLFNRVGNEIAKQTGQAAPTNFAAVRAMLAGELANVAKVSGATDPEIKEQRDYILSQNSPEQIAGLVDTNQHLMDQKAQEMFQQYESGMQGQPVFSKGGAKNHPTPTGGMIRAVDEKGVLHEAPAGTPLPKGWKAQ